MITISKLIKMIQGRLNYDLQAAAADSMNDVTLAPDGEGHELSLLIYDINFTPDVAEDIQAALADKYNVTYYDHRPVGGGYHALYQFKEHGIPVLTRDGFLGISRPVYDFEDGNDVDMIVRQDEGKTIVLLTVNADPNYGKREHDQITALLRQNGFRVQDKFINRDESRDNAREGIVDMPLLRRHSEWEILPSEKSIKADDPAVVVAQWLEGLAKYIAVESSQLGKEIVVEVNAATSLYTRRIHHDLVDFLADTYGEVIEEDYQMGDEGDPYQAFSSFVIRPTGGTKRTGLLELGEDSLSDTTGNSGTDLINQFALDEIDTAAEIIAKSEKNFLSVAQKIDAAIVHLQSALEELAHGGDVARHRKGQWTKIINKLQATSVDIRAMSMQPVIDEISKLREILA